MPRIHDIMESDQQHRHRRNRNRNHNLLLRGGSIFSLPTPFQHQPQHPLDQDKDSNNNSSNGVGGGGHDDNDATTLDGINKNNAVAGNDDDADEDDEDDDGCNSSVDLLADEDDGNNANNEFQQQQHSHLNEEQNPSSSQSHHCGQQQQKQQRTAPIPSALPAPAPIISPATKTLDRLSQFSSAEGGAELCMHLLADAAAAVYASSDIADDDVVVATHHHHHHHLPGTSCGSINSQGSGLGGIEKGQQVLASSRKVVVGAINNEKQVVVVDNDANATTEGNNNRNNNDVVNDGNDDDIGNKRQLCLRKLKEYFMSTKNSSTYAKQQQHRQNQERKVSAPPSIPFCLRCNHPSSNNTATTANNSSTVIIPTSKVVPPHHGLCPQHADFFDSGSYEILNLIVDGYLFASCEACMYQFDNGGRMDKSLCHADGCLRLNKKVKKKGSSSSSNRIRNGNSNRNSDDNKKRRELGVRGRDSTNASSVAQLPSLPPAVASKAIERVLRDDNRNNLSIDPAADDIKQAHSPDHFDSSGRPLSDYERLRLRNIQRNNARLDRLGLLANPGPVNVNKKPKGDNSDSGRPCLGTSNSRTNPRRTTVPEDSARDNVVDPASTSGRKKDSKDERVPTNDLVTCKKCITENQTGVKTKQCHDVNCPLRMRSSNTIRIKRVSDDVDAEPEKRTLHPHPIIVTKSSSNADGNQREHLEGSKKVVEPKSSQLLPRSHGDPNKLLEREDITESRIKPSIPRGNDESTNANTHQPTPSPLHHHGKTMVTKYGKNPPQIPSLTSLPSWIKEFSKESFQSVPSPRGSKWLPCPNPWGKFGHNDDDFVIISPFQSETMNEVLLSNIHEEFPKRFVSNPLDAGSPYHTTHCSPARGGYCVLRLRRDRSCSRPWGFTVRLHEFGGACLIDSIEPLSPAEAAEDISGWIDENASSSLQPHDMIICINGKCVGNMTMAELQIEFDVCGYEMLLTVSRFGIHETNSSQDPETLQDLEMDWSDIGAFASLKRKRVSFEDNEKEYTQDNDFDSELHGVEVDDGQNVAEDNTSRPCEMSEFPYSDKSLLEIHEKNAPEMKQLEGNVSLAMAAEVGCRKCKRELRTGIKTTRSHDQNCPRKLKPKKTIEKAQRSMLSGKSSDNRSQSVRTKSGLSQKRIRQKMFHDDGYDENEFSSKISTDNRSSRDRFDDDSDDDTLSCDTGNFDGEDGDDGAGDETLPETGGVVLALHPDIETTVTAAHDRNCPHKFKPKMTKEKKGARVKHSTPTGKAHNNNSQSKAKNHLPPKYENQEENHDVSPIDEVSDDENTSSLKRASNSRSSRDRVDDDSLSCEEDSDENPWLGCVCGNTHPHPIKVFWIQCEGCEAWYNAAEECLGFDENAAKELNNWCCWACDPPVAGMGL